VVYAFDRFADSGRPVPHDVETVIAERGHLPVTAIPLSADTPIQTFLDRVFRRVAIRLVTRNFSEDTMVVKDMGRYHRSLVRHRRWLSRGDRCWQGSAAVAAGNAGTSAATSAGLAASLLSSGDP
jgi:hypothetical protein